MTRRPPPQSMPEDARIVLQTGRENRKIVREMLREARKNAWPNTALTVPQVRSRAIFTSMVALLHGATPAEAVEIAQVIRGEKHAVGEDTLTVIEKLP